MKTLGLIGIAFIVIPLVIYVFLLLNTKKKFRKEFAFLERDEDLKNFVSYFYEIDTIKKKEVRNFHRGFNDKIEQFKNEYPDYYDKIDKKFIDNYFKRI